MKSEAQVKKDITAYLKSLGEDCWYYMPVPNGYGRRGVPDFLGCYKGKFFAIEAKNSDGGVLSPMQRRELHTIYLAGGHKVVATSVDDVKARFALFPWEAQ